MQPTSGTTTAAYIDTAGTNWYYSNNANITDGVVTITAGVSNKSGSDIHPELYFKYIKRKFSTLEGMKMNARLKRLEKAFNKAVENGQDALGEKFLKEITREMRETSMYAKGFKYFIEAEDLNKYKNRIRGGHISDTKFHDFTRVIPKDVLEKKKKSDGLFDGYVIYHYWNAKAEKVREGKQKMSPEEKQKMRDPVLFGVIKETNRLYFIADWVDEFCDLTFEEMIDVIGKDDKDHMIGRDPILNI